jgi:hypothetical protein
VIQRLLPGALQVEPARVEIADKIHDGVLPGFFEHFGGVVLQGQAAVAAARGERHLPAHGHRLTDRLHGVLLNDQDRQIRLSDIVLSVGDALRLDNREQAFKKVQSAQKILRRKMLGSYNWSRIVVGGAVLKERAWRPSER